MELKFRELIILTSTVADGISLTGYFARLCRTSKPSQQISYPITD